MLAHLHNMVQDRQAGVSVVVRQLYRIAIYPLFLIPLSSVSQGIQNYICHSSFVLSA